MTCWFPSRYRGRAMGVFFAVGASAGILVGPVSANLLRLDGWFGVAGWQWVFLAEGLPTLALAALCPFVLRDGPADAAWLAPAEREWLETRLQAERDAAIGRHLRTTRAIIARNCVADPDLSADRLRRLRQGLLPAADPQDLRLQQLAVGYWTSVPAAAGIVGMILFSQSSDRTGERVWHLMAPLLIGGLRLDAGGRRDRHQCAFWRSPPSSLASFGISGSLPVFWNLPTAFLGAAAAAGGIAFINSVGNISGYAAPQCVGLLRDFSGSYRLPMLVLGMMVTIAGIPRADRGPPAPDASLKCPAGVIPRRPRRV